jgi:predicted metal-binding protein
MEEDLRPIIVKALDWGVLDAKVIRSEDVVVAEWVRMKCRYGCPNYGRRLDCPPNTPDPELMRRLLGEYRRALVLKLTRLPHYQADRSGIVHRLERELYLNRFHRALAFGAGACGLCEECVREPGRCPYPHNIRPSAEGAGVDWFQTLGKAGWDIHLTPDKGELPPSYSLILVD